ncbi:IS21 family transposase [Bifidobacterium thermophilum]|nr:IS21 family transposase [Bifidobacterium thermophilum]
MVLTGWCLYIHRKGPGRIMAGMPQVRSIRRLRRNGESVASIARKTHAGGADGVQVPGEGGSVGRGRRAGRTRALAVGPVFARGRSSGSRSIVRTGASSGIPRPGSGSGRGDEHGMVVSLSTVTRVVARPGRGFAAGRDEAFMDLVWHPGEAQADFGEVDVLLAWCSGCIISRLVSRTRTSVWCSRCRARTLSARAWRCATCSSGWAVCRSGSCSITPPAWAIRGTGSGSRVRRRLFHAFQAHYGFDCSFCNPYSGHEKGAVESKVGMVRRKLFVSRPSVWSLENSDAGLPDRCLEPAVEPHCRKDTDERGLFSEDRAALLPLPGKRFDVGRVAAYEGRPVRRGRARGRHRCSADRADAGREPVVGLRALEARGPRLVGQAPGDPSSGVRPGQHEQRGPVHAVGAAVQQARVLDQHPGA